MTPDELTAIEALTDAISGEHADWHTVPVHPADIRVLLAALRTEQEARARVEAAARIVVDDCLGYVDFGAELFASWPNDDDRMAEEHLIALHAALAPDASEGGET